MPLQFLINFLSSQLIHIFQHNTVTWVSENMLAVSFLLGYCKLSWQYVLYFKYVILCGLGNKNLDRQSVLVSAAAGNKSTTRPPLPPPACGGE